MPESPEFELLPVTDDFLSAEDDLTAALEGVLADPEAVEETVVPPKAFGRGWLFDFTGGGGVGLQPRAIGESDQLRFWVQSALRTARNRHSVLPPDFGIESPNRVIGLSDPVAALAILKENLSDALTMHDRISAVTNIETDFDGDGGIATVGFRVVLDDETQISFKGLEVAS